MPVKPSISRVAALLVAVSGMIVPSALGQWTAVPPVNFSSLQLSQFADHELEVPYFLNHFAQVANSVVETGTDRGFLNIKVNREPVDNQPYNARIMENQLSLAYFYTANRPWNPYRGSTAVKVRLEAMLDRWTRIQNQPGLVDGDFDGLFAEYSASNWSLAPTGFGLRAAAEAVDLIIDSGLPFDAAILEAARVSLRRGLIAIYTRSDMRSAARTYSNQFSGAHHAALIYLENWPDAEVDAAFVAALNASSTQDQSPAGFWYEAGGPDFGYSDVHENNFRIALQRLRNRSDLMPVVIGDDIQWNDWLAANHVPQPGATTRTFISNAGLNTRTSYSFGTPNPRPISEFVVPSRTFAYTDAEYAAYLVTRRSQVQSQFGNWGALAVPSAYSYNPGFVHDAVTNLNVWSPSAAQRTAADATLPCLSPTSFNRQYRDSLPFSVTIAKRPQYYAAVSTGTIRVSRQAYGLGLLWNPSFGIALQSVAGTLSTNTLLYGTKRSSMTGTYETSNIPATITAGGVAAPSSNGVTNFASGDVSLTYSLAASGTTYGQKTITLGESRVDVSVTHSGSFSELLPLAHASDCVLTVVANKITLARSNGSSLIVETNTPGATISVGGTSTLATGVVRRPVTITASGSLSYSLTVSDGNASPPEVLDPAVASTVADGYVDVDLRDLTGDAQTPDDRLAFGVGPAVGGGVQLLGDGHIVRFTHQSGAGGNASFSFTARDQGNDSRLLRHYRFESPDSSTDGLASDSSAFAANGELAAVGTGTATFETDSPQVFPSGENRSLRLLEPDAANYARLRTNLPASTYDLSNNDWSASFWYKRATKNTHDFLFYIGNGNGFSGDGHELEVYAPANSDSLQMSYWDGSNTRLANLSSGTTAPLNQWNHVAVVWNAHGGGNGTMTLFLNGSSVGSADFTAAFKQTSPLVFGGIQSSAADPRNFNGWIDDVALYSSILDVGEITSLASQPVANHAGLEASGTVSIRVDPFANGLSAYWPFDGNLDDLSGRVVQVIPSGAAATTSAILKEGVGSLALPTAGDYVSTASPLSLGNVFTLSAWIYLPSGANSIRTIAANSTSGFNANGFRFFVNRFNAMDGELVLETGNGSGSTNIVSPAGTVLTDRWQHVAAVVDRTTGTATLFRNGEAVASGAVRNDFQNLATLNIGAMQGGLQPIRGNIDGFRIHSRLLATGELLDIFSTSNMPPGLTPPASFTMAAGTQSTARPVMIDDEESGPAPLVVSASSSDPGLLPNENITLGGSGANRTVTVSPVSWRAGPVTVTLSVSDGLLTTEETFDVTVTNGGSSALWTSTATQGPSDWNSPGNWALARPPYPGAASGVDFLTGVITPAGTIVAQQDIATPFVVSGLTFGGSGLATVRHQGPSLSLVANGAGTPSVLLTATGAMTHSVEMPLQLGANANVSGNGDAQFEFSGEISGAAGITKTGSSSMTLGGQNTYNGSTQILSGTIRVTDPLALGSVAAGTTVEGGTALAALEMSGGMTLAEPVRLNMQNTESHTQLRNLSGDNTLTGQLSLSPGGARWDIACLSGSLTISGPVVNIASVTDTWRTLYLRGPAAGSITGSMTDSAGGNSKLNVNISSGTWSLTGTPKTYTGITTVNGGVLNVNAALASRITVQNGGALSGSGSSSGDLTVETGSTFSTRITDWNAAPGPFQAARLVATSAASWTVRLDTSGISGFSESPRSIPLITTTSGLVNVNPATINVQVSGFPGSGNWTIETIGNSLSLAYEPDLYQAWSSTIAWNGKDSSPTGDPDADGLVNLMEYALGGDPLRSGDGAVPVVSLVSGRLRLEFVRVADPALLYEVIGSDDLAAPASAWSPVWSSTGVANIAGPVVVDDAVIVPTPALRFLRLRVTR